LNYTDPCAFKIDVGWGNIKLTFQNVSLPDDAIVAFDLCYSDAKFLNISQLRGETQIRYTKSYKTTIFIFGLQENVTDVYQGVKLHYTIFPEGR
jgi:hypothetical protein